MVQWVYEAAVASSLGEVIVATPNQEIVEVCQENGMQFELTRGDHASGTDRLVEVALRHSADVILNVQGDEPLISASTIQACFSPFSDASVLVSSVYSECAPEDVEDPNIVKVVLDLNGYALYFSRYAVPFSRAQRELPIYRHFGIYGFRREVLLEFANWEQTPLEKAESLEQLRFLEHGVRIAMREVSEVSHGVDTPEQVADVERMLRLRS